MPPFRPTPLLLEPKYSLIFSGFGLKFRKDGESTYQMALEPGDLPQNGFQKPFPPSA